VGRMTTFRPVVALVVVVVAVAAGVASVSSSAESATSALRLVRVASGLESPVHVTSAPGEPDRLYVVEQGGLVKVVEQGKVRAAPFLDIRSKVASGSEQGLLGLAFAPDYAKSRLLVVDYTDRGGNTRVVRYRANGTRALPGSARVLLTVGQPYSNHNGGMVAFGPGGLLYVGTGDGGSGGDPENRAQSMSTQLGKLLRLNPRVARPTPKIVALGLRNPWRFSFDRKTGDLWIGDVGQNSVEEVDKLPRRRLGSLVNFGWDVFEGTQSYEEKPLGPGSLVQPVAEYSHDNGCSVTGGYVYRGKKVRAASGRYFYGDYCSGRVWSVRAASPRAAAPRLERFRVASLTSFGEDRAGELYLVSQNGTIFRLAG
jgi:glucose/arabinose dehydrogenase